MRRCHPGTVQRVYETSFWVRVGRLVPSRVAEGPQELSRFLPLPLLLFPSKRPRCVSSCRPLHLLGPGGVSVFLARTRGSTFRRAMALAAPSSDTAELSSLVLLQ